MVTILNILVVKQDPNIPPSQRWAAIFTKTTFHKMAASVPVFSALFGCVCALEFSVNERAKSQFGPKAGLKDYYLMEITYI
jgi:hypothetical protein